jgi:hypothetical protein
MDASRPAIATQRLAIRHALGEQQSFDTIYVLDPRRTNGGGAKRVAIRSSRATHEDDARGFLTLMRARFEKFALALHPEKTRLIEFVMSSAAGLKRLGVPFDDRHYFDLHSVLDVKHSLAWNAEAIFPLVAANPNVAPAIAEGALMRLQCGARCFVRLSARARMLIIARP